MPDNDDRVRSRELRDRARMMRANPTDAEARLWTMLRDRRMPAAKFRRQHVIEPYIVDFASLEHGLIIEADGSQHADSRADQHRDGFLRRNGFRVLRFWNNDVLNNPGGVFELISSSLHTLTLPLLRNGSLPLPCWERG